MLMKKSRKFEFITANPLIKRIQIGAQNSPLPNMYSNVYGLKILNEVNYSGL